MRQRRLELALYGLMVALASVMMLMDERFWAGFCIGGFCSMVYVKLVVVRWVRPAG